MNLIIGGHMRSGTTLLWEICNSHPELAVTQEFGCYTGIGKPLIKQHWIILRRCLDREGNIFYPFKSRFRNRLIQNSKFAFRYLYNISLNGSGIVSGERIGKALRNLLPKGSIIGDKFPYYAFMLDRLVEVNNLKILIMYRDPRDVVSSSLELVRSIRGSWTRYFKNAEKVILQWLRAMDLMERNSKFLHSIRYEILVTNPEEETEKLGQYLGVSSCGFNTGIVKQDRIVKYRETLTNIELKTIIDLAGQTTEKAEYRK